MNCIQRIVLRGELCATYSTLYGTYYFQNDRTESISSRYCFSVPAGACLTGLSVLDESKQILQGEVSALGRICHRPEASLCQISPDFYALQWNGISPGETIALQVTMQVRLCPVEGTARLVIPLGEAEYEYGVNIAEPCLVELDFYGPLAEAGKSPTHTLQREPLGKETHLFCETKSGEDFVLDLSVTDMRNQAVLEKDLGQGMGLYRLVTANRDLYRGEKISSVLFLLDLSGVHNRAEAGAVKELLFRIILALPEESKIQILTTDREKPVIFPDFTWRTEEICDRLFQHLTSLVGKVGGVCDMLKEEAYQKHQGAIMLVSNGTPTDRADILAEIPARKPMVLFTVGRIKETAFTRGWAAAGGRHTHFYKQEQIEKRLPHLLAPFLYRAEPVEVLPLEGNVKWLRVLSGVDIATCGYCDMVLAYTGVPPRRFALQQNGICREECVFEQMEEYTSVPAIGQLYTENEIQRLLLLMTRTTPDTYLKIKKELMELGTTYRVIGPETAIVLQGAPKEVGVVTSFCLDGGGKVAGSSWTSIFGDEQDNVSIPPSMEDKILTVCKRRLAMACGADGGIFSGMEQGYDFAEQTAFALAALTLLGGKEYMPIRERAKAYLDANPAGGLSGQFPLRRDYLIQFLLENRRRVLDVLPVASELLCDLNKEYASPLAAAQMVLYLALTRGERLGLL